MNVYCILGLRLVLIVYHKSSASKRQSEQAWYVNIEQFGKIGMCWTSDGVIDIGHNLVSFSVVIRPNRKVCIESAFFEEGLN